MDKKCNIHGNIKECLRVLNKEWKRDDNSICNKSTKDLQLETKCDIELIKKLIVRLRRAMPLKTISHGYNLSKYAETDFNLLKSIIEEDIHHYASVLGSRWIISILDTYTDWGRKEESKNALLVSSIIHMERIACTEKLQIRNLTYPFSTKEVHKPQKLLWSGLKTTNLDCDDFYSNFLYRIKTSLKDTPSILIMLQYLFKEMLKNEKSSLHTVCNHSKFASKKMKEI